MARNAGVAMDDDGSVQKIRNELVLSFLAVRRAIGALGSSCRWR